MVLATLALGALLAAACGDGSGSSDGSDAVYFIATEADSPHGYVTRVTAKK
jgi:hypothetical protein